MILIPPMKVAFQMEPMEESDRFATDSLLIMQEACKRGYEVFHYRPEHLSIGQRNAPP